MAIVKLTAVCIVLTVLLMCEYHDLELIVYINSVFELHRKFCAVLTAVWSLETFTAHELD